MSVIPYIGKKETRKRIRICALSEERGRRRAYAQKNTGSERQAAALKKAITIKYVRACAHELRDICLLPLQSPHLYDIIGDGGKI